MEISEQSMKMMIANSYKNFHAKGLDYLCLFRSEKMTLKYYFFDGDHTKLPEVVNPHNHRYDFSSRVVAGNVIDYTFQHSLTIGRVYNKFDWMTPLNGGNGFTFIGEQRLERVLTQTIGRGLYNAHNAIHTIRIAADQSILELVQMEDVIPLDKPTQLFSLDDAAPNTSGLYEKFTSDEILARIKTLKELGKLP